MKIYQAQLPMATRRIKPLTPLPPLRPQPPAPPSDAIAHNLQRCIEEFLLLGYWFCTDCKMTTERMEDDHGQPAHCSRCGGHHLVWNPPID